MRDGSAESARAQDHLTRASALRDEATAILDRVGLRDVISAYGTVVVHGSYALDVMVWRDLDIYLVLAAPRVAAFFEIGARIATLLEPHRMQYRDELDGSSTHLPRGLYWGIYLRERPFGDWKIDLWGVDAAEADRLTQYEEAVSHQLSAISRETILRIKNAVHTHEQYRRAFGAKDIYDAVLAHGVRDVIGFAAYLDEKLGITIDQGR